MENKNRKTYCNPLSIPSIPRGTDGWQIMDFTGEEPSDYRSISDPSVLYENGRWYLYPSYGMDMSRTISQTGSISAQRRTI